MLIPIRDRNPTQHTPVVTILLIVANVAAFLLIGASPEAVFRFGAVPCDVVDNCPQLSSLLAEEFPTRSSLLSLITSMFMHGDIVHLGGNMLFLWVFGNNIEDRLGVVKYVVFYAVCGLAAAAAHILVFAGSQVPVVGASGAISGILGAYLVMFPKARVISLVLLGFVFTTVELSAKVVLGLWFVMQVLMGVAGIGFTGAEGGGGGVAFLAHVGGFVAGWLLIRVFRPRPRERSEPARPLWPDDDSPFS